MKFEIASHLVEGQRKKSTDFFCIFFRGKRRVDANRFHLRQRRVLDHS
jgi:hypothetical protein